MVFLRKAAFAFVLALITSSSVVEANKMLTHSSGTLNDTTLQKIQAGKLLNPQEKKEVEETELTKIMEFRRSGIDEVSNTREPMALREYRRLAKKRTGIFRKRQASLTEILFPGDIPVEYRNHERIWMTTNLVQSKRSPIAFDISDLPGFAELKDAPVRSMTLGSGLEGYAFAFKNASSFEIVVKKDIPCTSFSSVKIDTKKRGMLQKLIEGQFRLHFQLDGLPVLMRSKESHYPVKGAAVGFVAPPMYAGLARNTMYLFNHFKFVITYQEDPSMYQGVRITGFDVIPVSKKHDESLSTCSGIDVVNRPTEYLLDLDDVMLEQNVVFSYDVKWVQSELEWVDRWDVYFLGLPGLPDDDIHYFGMSNSLMNILIMTCLISIILIRIFRKDIVGGGKKETGWKHVHADVFRPPSFSPMLLSVFVGNGVHLGTAAILTMILNVLNFTNTMTTGAVLTSLILVYALCGPICGYVSARLYKLFGGDDCKRNAALAAAALPGGSLAAFCLVNIFVWVDGGTTVDFMSMLVLVILFCCVAVPLVLLGDRIGRLAPCIEVPTTTSDAVRPIPVSKWTKGKSPAMFAGGLLILSTMNIELHFIMGALWVKQYYVTMGVLLMSTLIMVIACAQVSICICYCQLYCEDHRWWWASFRNCASTSVFMALYSLWYLNRLQLIGGLSVLIYLTYMSLASICIGLVCGSIGFLASLWFTRTIYGALQIDRSLKDVEDVGNESVPLTNGCEESSDSK